jgi:hypothetical protein
VLHSLPERVSIGTYSGAYKTTPPQALEIVPPSLNEARQRAAGFQTPATSDRSITGMRRSSVGMTGSAQQVFKPR